MNQPSRLFDQFCDALNAELRAMGSQLHVARDQPEKDEAMLLVDAQGRELGWLPDHVDAASIVAFERILRLPQRDGNRKMQ